MNWKADSYNMQKSGHYAVTKHPTSAGGYFYLAWHKSDELGEFDTAEAARAACDAHEAKA